MNTETKVCSKCGKEKEFNQFHKNKRKKLGLNSFCKVCSNEATAQWRKKNSEKVKESARIWKKKNPEKVKEQTKNRRLKNPEKVRMSQSKWNEKNPEYYQNYYQRNKKIKDEKAKVWRENNPEKAKIITQRSKITNKQNIHNLLKQQSVNLSDLYLIRVMRNILELNTAQIRQNPDLIQAYREQIKTKRLLRTIKKDKKCQVV